MTIRIIMISFHKTWFFVLHCYRKIRLLAITVDVKIISIPFRQLITHNSNNIDYLETHACAKSHKN